jgi:hypothetical protein
VTYRRPRLRTLTLTAVISLVASAVFALSRPPEMLVDGQRVVSDVPPVTTSGHVFVPLRSVADALGAQTTDDEKSGVVEVIHANRTLRLHVGDVHATLDGMPLTLKHPPFRVRGRTMIGLQALARAFDVRTQYDRRLGRIDVMTPGIGQAFTPATILAPTQ